MNKINELILNIKNIGAQFQKIKAKIFTFANSKANNKAKK